MLQLFGMFVGFILASIKGKKDSFHFLFNSSL